MMQLSRLLETEANNLRWPLFEDGVSEALLLFFLLPIIVFPAHLIIQLQRCILDLLSQVSPPHSARTKSFSSKNA